MLPEALVGMGPVWSLDERTLSKILVHRAGTGIRSASGFMARHIWILGLAGLLSGHFV
jgi:hypothetical protein